MVRAARILCVAGPIWVSLLAFGSVGQGTTDQSGSGNPYKKLSLEQLGNIEVTTASKQPEEVWNTPAAIYVLTQEDIRRSGATNIPDVLRLVPGVQVARINGDRNWAVGIRGFGDQFSKSVLVLIDGRSVYTPLFAGVLWTVNNVVMEDIDRIEVIRGPGGTIWGANAVNGIINIITKPASETHGVLASAGGGNVDQFTGDFRVGGGNGNGLDYRIDGTGFNRGPEYHTDGQNYDDSRLGQAGFRTDWKRSAQDTYTFQGDIYKGQFGDAQRLSTFTPPSNFISYAAMDASGENLLGRWRRDTSEGSNLYLQAYWDRTYRLGSNFGETRDTFDVDFLHRLPSLARQQFTYGAGARISPSTFRQVIATDNFLPHQQTDSIYSGFLQDEIAVIPKKVSLTLGSKLEHNNYTGFEFQPSARLLWRPSKTQSVWAGVTRAVRTPSRVDADIDVTVVIPGAPLIAGQVLGNREIRAERLISYEAGYRKLVTSKFYVAISAFYNDYNDLVAQGAPTISFAATPPPPHLLALFQYVNGIRGNTKGIEIAPDWQPSHWWELKGSYSYLHLNLADLAGGENNLTLPVLMGSSPSHEAEVQSRFNLPKRFEFDQIYRYVSALPAQEVRAYHTADVRVGWHASKQVELSLVGQNLLQPHHAEFGIDPGPTVLIKRSIYARIVWTR
ncbi:MAG: TonB-dependent receptor [Acidobacteriaceae bacterium]